MNKEKIFNMSLFAIFASFILVLGLVPNLGYITIVPGASITIIHIPVLIGIMFLPLVYSLGLGFIFGITSLIASFIYAKSLFDYAFQNPLISIVPRVLFALVAYFIFHGLKAFFKKVKHGKYYSFAVVIIVSILFGYFVGDAITKITGWDIYIVYTTVGVMILTLIILYFYFLSEERYKNLTYVPTVFIVSSLIHSILVLFAVALLKPAAYEGANIFGVIFAILSTNALIEALAAFLIGSPIIVALANIKETEAKRK